MKTKQAYNNALSHFDPVAQHLELQRYYKHLAQSYKRAQFVVSNTTDSPQEVRLWGANSDVPLTENTQFNNQFNTTQTVNVGNYPQGIVYNPATDLFYVANQLSSTISVLDAWGTLIETIALSPILVVVGTFAPIALAINTRSDSSSFGLIYVINSVRDTINIIDRNHNLVGELATAKRPIDIAYNPVDDMLYVDLNSSYALCY